MKVIKSTWKLKSTYGSESLHLEFWEFGGVVTSSDLLQRMTISQEFLFPFIPGENFSLIFLLLRNRHKNALAGLSKENAPQVKAKDVFRSPLRLFSGLLFDNGKIGYQGFGWVCFGSRWNYNRWEARPLVEFGKLDWQVENVFGYGPSMNHNTLHYPFRINDSGLLNNMEYDNRENP